jgi:flagellar hook protein FlgE
MLSVIMSGLKVAQKDLGVTANNLANSGTIGFKRSDANFVDVFASDPGADPKTQVGAGAIADVVQRSMTQGAMTTTDRVTDLAIAGRGFFILSPPAEEGVTDATGDMYTRAGNFSIDSTGKVVDNVGNQLQVFEVDDAGVVNKESLVGATIPSVNDAGALLQSISISSKGVVEARYSDDTVKNVGVVALASFPNDGALKAIGGSKFIASGESGLPVLTPPGAPSAGDILSATLEEANVDITQELMGMLRAQQIYNGNARMLQTAMEVTSRITDKL